MPRRPFALLLITIFPVQGIPKSTPLPAYRHLRPSLSGRPGYIGPHPRARLRGHVELLKLLRVGPTRPDHIIWPNSEIVSALCICGTQNIVMSDSDLEPQVTKVLSVRPPGPSRLGQTPHDGPCVCFGSPCFVSVRLRVTER